MIEHQPELTVIPTFQNFKHCRLPLLLAHKMPMSQKEICPKSKASKTTQDWIVS